MKFSISIVLSILLFACTPAELQRVLDNVQSSAPLSKADIAKGLKEALKIGISKGADELAQKDGYYKSIYKILLPDEAMTIINRVKRVPGFGNVETMLLEKINRAAEDAATKAKPIFVDAITGMSFSDAMSILKGPKNAATEYLSSATRSQLYEAFNPVIVNSLNKMGALDYWTSIVNTYNKIPFIKKMNPKLDDHITRRSLDGLFSKIELKEKEIRTNVSARTSDLLRRVFAKQD